MLYSKLNKIIVTIVLLATGAYAQQPPGTTIRRRLITPAPAGSSAVSAPFTLDTRPKAPSPVWVSEPAPPVTFALAFAETARVYGVGNPDASRVSAYPNGSRLAIAWAAPADVSVSLMLKTGDSAAVGWLVFGGKDTGAATVTLDRLGWSRAGPFYVEAFFQGTGANHLKWRSDAFLLLKAEDGEDEIARAVAAATGRAEPTPPFEIKRAEPSVPATAFTRDLTVGSRGADVVSWQSYLESKGFVVMPSGVARGYFGSLTKAATAAWQKARGISPPNGRFGPIERAAANADFPGGRP